MADTVEEERKCEIIEESRDVVDSGYESENVVALRKKLQLKMEALAISSQKLDRCRAQRDQFKLMAEQIQERFLDLKKQTTEARKLNGLYNLDDDYVTLDLLLEVREQNKCLRLQVETLRQKLDDAQGDIKVLRKSNRTFVNQREIQLAPAVHQRDEMIGQLEELNIKVRCKALKNRESLNDPMCAQLQTDLQTLLDEKQELETERDAFKRKTHRLNHELSKALDASKPVDLDALINENRYLQERLQQLLEEKELAEQSLSKYKSMLDSKRVKGAIKLGGNSAAGTVMTHKQVEQLLQQGSRIPPQRSAAAMSDLRCLCAALLEALNDKTLALAHQKKANKILASRICELDNTVQSPTMKLLEGYTDANIDSTCKRNLDECDHESNSKSALKVVTEKNDDVQIKENFAHSAHRVAEHLNSVQMRLPENLETLVQKALTNLKDGANVKS